MDARIGVRLTWVVLFAIGMLATACGEQDQQSDSLHIYATTSVLGDVASTIAGDDADVSVLIPIGADPHSFAPSSSQVAEMGQADLVIANGLGLEESFEAVLEGIESDGGSLLEIGPALDPIPFGAGVDAHDHEDEGEAHDHEDEGEAHDHEDEGEAHDHEDEGDGHDHGSDDPHVWMDPLRMAEAGRLIAEALAELDDSVDWMARAEAYATELEEVDVEIQQILAGIPEESRVLVTNHDSLGYFAARYGFDVVGTVLPGGSTLGDPSSDQLANLVQLMRELDVRVIFAETTEPSSLAEAVSQEVGDSVQVVELYSGSLGEPGSGAETLTEMLLVNARLIAESMQ